MSDYFSPDVTRRNGHGDTPPSEENLRHALATREMRAAYEQFSRNGRWGTCSGCPRGNFGAAFPEFCQFTERYDHQLNHTALASAFDDRLKRG